MVTKANIHITPRREFTIEFQVENFMRFTLSESTRFVKDYLSN